MHISSKKILDLNIPCIVAFCLLHFLGISVVLQAYLVYINLFMIYLKLITGCVIWCSYRSVVEDFGVLGSFAVSVGRNSCLCCKGILSLWTVWPGRLKYCVALNCLPVYMPFKKCVWIWCCKELDYSAYILQITQWKITFACPTTCVLFSVLKWRS
jgi:hypothetical protein